MNSNLNKLNYPSLLVVLLANGSLVRLPVPFFPDFR